MSTPVAIVAAGGPDRSEMPGFPPAVAAEIVRFLRSGATGNFQVTVKDGRITGCHVTTFVSAHADPRPQPLDLGAPIGHDSRQG
jgi:hypothetical protein